MKARIYINGQVFEYISPTPTKRSLELLAEARAVAAVNGRKFRMTKKIRTKLQCCAINMFRNRSNNLTFVTLTLPEAKSHKEVNKCLSMFHENLKKNYGLKNYIAVGERGEENGRLHYHCLYDLPFIDIRVFSVIWSSTLGYYGKNAPFTCQLPKEENRSIVDDPLRLVKYLTKYISKSLNQEFDARCYFVTRQLLQNIYTTVEDSDAIIETTENNEKQLKGTEKKLVTTYSCSEFNCYYIKDFQPVLGSTDKKKRAVIQKKQRRRKKG